MKTNLNIIIIFSALIISILSSCTEKKTQENEIIVPVPKVEAKKGTQSMQQTNNSRDVEWLNSNYKVVISRKPDKSLPLSKDEYGQDYYDNTVTLRVLRADGSEAINHVFHKSEFLSYINEKNVRTNGALLGVVFDKVEKGNLVFAASVGSPNDSSDEFIPLVVHVNRLGAISIAIDTSLDGNSSTSGNTSATSADEDYGV